MITLVISDTEGNELESMTISVNDVLPFINLIKEFGYLDDNGDEHKFYRAQVLTGKDVYVDVK